MWISWKKYEKSCQDYQKNWALLNQTLYDLCKNYRDHQEMSAINAKFEAYWSNFGHWHRTYDRIDRGTREFS